MISSQICTNKTDTELVALTLENGDNYYCLMHRYEEKLLRYIRHLADLPLPDCQDILQDSFVKAYLNLNDFDSGLKFSSWIYRIVHNQTVNFLQKHHRRLSLNPSKDNTDFFEWIASDTNLEKEVIDSNFSQYIHTLLDKLDEKYKQVLVLKFIEGKDYQEISDILQKPIGTIGTLVNRAKKQFRTIYDRHQPKNS